MDIRNVTIIAHVDHGKTTLVDGMLKQTHTFRDNQSEMTKTTILDRMDLEREKGITILAKNTAVVYGDTKINIIDTPGHADFSGEVERVINMADGAILLVDAAEGPLPQTEFVLAKSLERDLPLIVIINKIDRKDARPDEVLYETENLIMKLARSDRHLDFAVLYAVGREGKVWKELPSDLSGPGNLRPLFESILSHVPAPVVVHDEPFRMQVSALEYDTHKGMFAIGKATGRGVAKGQQVAVYAGSQKKGTHTVTDLWTSKGLERIEVENTDPGDIIALAGIPGIAIGDTVADVAVEKGFPMIEIGEPTISITLAPNTSPYAGREGTYSTASQIEERLEREKRSNVGMRIERMTTGGFRIAGRGELHLAILLEQLRREGYEFEVGKPEVILRTVDGIIQEPYEEVTIETEGSVLGPIIEELGRRKGTLVDTITDQSGMTRMVYRISSWNLFGFRSALLTLSRGKALFASSVLGYFPKGDRIERMRNGALISLETGVASAYSLETVQERGTPFIGPGEKVYEGMIIGINRRSEDIEINVCKTKKLTNIHSATADIAIHLEPPTRLSLEQCIDILEVDELLEVTPESLRLRKRHLTKIARARAERSARSDT